MPQNGQQVSVKNLSQEDVAMRVRLMRTRMGKKQSEIAQLLGISTGYYVKLELRHRDWTNELIDKAAVVFGVDSTWVRNGDAQPNQNLPSIVAESKMPWPAETAATKAPDDWLDQFISSLKSKSAVIDVAIREYNLPIRDAIEPAIDDYEKRMHTRNRPDASRR
jgi:transcriptional regulator with XRE-family HTH domain